jgi:elongator complex protein 5
MAPSAIAQRRTHNLLLFQKLLNLRDGASPFTLLLDTLEQSAKPVIQEFITRAKVSQRRRINIFLYWQISLLCLANAVP